MLNGYYLSGVLVAVCGWFSLLWSVSRTSIRGEPPPDYFHRTLRAMAASGLVCCTVGVGALLALCLSWVSADVSQWLGVRFVTIIAPIVTLPTLPAFFLSIAGSWTQRLLGMGSAVTLLTAWIALSLAGMAPAVPMVRHPNRFLLPDGYVGWVDILYDQHDGPALPPIDGKRVLTIPATGLLKTVSSAEEGWGSDEYFYLSPDGRSRSLPQAAMGKGGMIWDEGFSGNHARHSLARRESFFVGTEAQYRSNKQPHPSERLAPQPTSPR